MERWRQIESLFQEALQHDLAERDAWLRKACRGDSDLRREVASLLANHHEAANSKAWAVVAATQLISGRTSVEAGQRLGPYEIIAPIGAGGMGEVYKARDTRLKRDVAIKICAAQFSERFEREARAIAALNHPNICQIYDVGPNYLVMELVEGENLSGPLPLETAFNYARQIAEALEAAHEKGIVHRDLKPANVKITQAGVAKVLDFGLAKAAEESTANTDAANSPTLTMSPTRTGVILGTAAYMSPEQARGAAVDKRADIWAFGCVLYEMLTGRQPFHGETTWDILAAVLKEEPDWSRIPARVQPVLRRCLEKDPKRRLRDIGDAMPLFDAAPVPAATSVRRPWPWLVSVVIAIFAILGWWRATRSAPLRPLVRLSADLPPDTAFSPYSANLALSPDGKRLAAVVRGGDGNNHLSMRRLDQGEFALLPGTEGALKPFFSPDGEWLGFFADGKLKKVEVQGGSPVSLCDAPASTYGASWGDDGNIIAALDQSRLWRIPSGGGAPTAMMQPNREKNEMNGWPQVLPGSQSVLFAGVVAGGSFDDANIDVLSLKTGKRTTVLRGGFFGRYLATSIGAGHLVYMHGNALFAAPFDLSRLAVTGAPQRMFEDVSSINRYGASNFDFSGAPSGSGTFAYISSMGQSPWLIYWLDSAGKIEPILSTPGFYWTPRVSPDGTRLAFAMGAGPAGGSDLWVKDLKRGATTRLSSLSGWNYWPVWTPDGKNIVYAWVSSAARGLYWVRVDGSSEPQLLTDRGLPYSFSPDGRRLTYELGPGQQNYIGPLAPRRAEIWTAPVEGDSEHPRLGKAERFLGTERTAAFSPDGRWLAYTSNETGTSEIYVRPYPGPGSKWQISAGGGQIPVWSPNAGELFFYSGGRIWVVNYSAKGDSFTRSKPRLWSQKSLMTLVVGSTFDLSPDGKRFAVMLYPDGKGESKPVTHVTVLLNFFDELRRRAPAGGK